MGESGEAKSARGQVRTAVVAVPNLVSLELVLALSAVLVAMQFSLSASVGIWMSGPGATDCGVDGSLRRSGSQRPVFPLPPARAPPLGRYPGGCAG